VSEGFNAQVVRGLAFVRFLYSQGLDQAQRPQPLATTALLSFHDAVEMFLGVSADHLGVNLPQNVTFDGYFDQIKQGAGIDLPGRRPMRRMNRSRVSLKHHTIFPSPTDLEQLRADVTTFLTDATQMVFNADFLSLDMIDLVTQPNAVTLLRRAETCASQGEHTEALALLSEAFEELLDDYANRKKDTAGNSPYLLRTLFVDSMFGRDHDPELTRRIGQVEGVLNRMQRVIRVLAIGVDYRHYARFELLVPNIIYTADGSRFVAAVPGLEVGDAEYQFCKQFVIETALHMAELDFDLDLYKVRVKYQFLQETAADRPGTSGA
jgi:hypothetical protein